MPQSHEIWSFISLFDLSNHILILTAPTKIQKKKKKKSLYSGNLQRRASHSDGRLDIILLSILIFNYTHIFIFVTIPFRNLIKTNLNLDSDWFDFSTMNLWVDWGLPCPSTHVRSCTPVGSIIYVGCSWVFEHIFEICF